MKETIRISSSPLFYLFQGIFHKLSLTTGTLSRGSDKKLLVSGNFFPVTRKSFSYTASFLSAIQKNISASNSAKQAESMAGFPLLTP